MKYWSDVWLGGVECVPQSFINCLYVVIRVLVMKWFTVLDLYSGPGGLSLGFSKAKSSEFGFQVVVANDIDRDAVATYKVNHPGVTTILGDLTSEEVKREIVCAVKRATGRSTVDLVIGGPPCRGFSSANRMTRNNSNPLNYLAIHFAEMVKRVNPFAFVMENVPGMLSLHNGRILEDVKRRLRDHGYSDTDPWVLDSADYGVPQRRRRMFFMGSKSASRIEPPKKTHGPPEEVNTYQYLKPYATVGDVIGRDLPAIPEGVSSPPSDEYTCAPETELQAELRRKSKNVQNHSATVSSSLVVKRFRHVLQGGNWRDIPEDLMRAEGKYKNLSNMHSIIYRRLNPKEPSVTVTNFRKAMLIHPTQDRLLSVREAARIQTFPDRYWFEGARSSMQQQVSDAVPVRLAESVANTVLAHMMSHVQYVYRPAKVR